MHIVIEWSGNSQEIDGATIHGVYSDSGRAERLAATMPDADIIVRVVDEGVGTSGDDDH